MALAAVDVDREKVIKGLECCYADGMVQNCEECPYAEQDGTCYRIDPLLRDALAMLKAQEPVEPVQDMVGDALFWVCGKCGYDIMSTSWYCPNCGRKVKWND